MNPSPDSLQYLEGVGFPICYLSSWWFIL